MRKHSFIAKVQLQQVCHLRNNLQMGEGVLQIDFAENFSIK